MRHVYGLVIIGFSVLMGGCLSPKTSGVVVEKGRLIIEDASFALNLDVIQDATTRTSEGFLRAQVAVKNTNQQDYRCQYRFQWLQDSGLMQTHAETPWRPAVMHGREQQVFEAVAPVAADDFRLVIRKMRKED